MIIVKSVNKLQLILIDKYGKCGLKTRNPGFWFFLLFTITTLSLNTILAQQIDSLTVLNKSYSFFVIGDWGRNGDFNQRELADVMNTSAGKLWTRFVATTGDNFYENGVASVDDPLWMSSFENVYNGGSLLMEWHPTLGNHDYRGNTKAQIEYSKKSRRWSMPDYYYSFTEKVNSEKVLFVFIDANQFEDNYYNYPNRYPDLAGVNPQKQLNWIDSVLSNSDAKWKIMFGHQHVYTGGVRVKEISRTAKHLEPLLKKYNVDVYFCGHEHDLQHIKPEGTTHYFVSGAGSQLRPTGYTDQTLFAKSVQGFCAVSVVPDKMLVQMVDYTGNVIYKYTIEK